MHSYGHSHWDALVSASTTGGFTAPIYNFISSYTLTELLQFGLHWIVQCRAVWKGWGGTVSPVKVPSTLPPFHFPLKSACLLFICTYFFLSGVRGHLLC